MAHHWMSILLTEGLPITGESLQTASLTQVDVMTVHNTGYFAAGDSNVGFAPARLSSTQSKSAIYLRLALNIKTHIRLEFKASQAWFLPRDSRPQGPSRHYQPASLRTSGAARECGGSNLHKSPACAARIPCRPCRRSRSEPPSRFRACREARSR